MQGILYLEDGTMYVGEGIGKRGTTVGEIVFNTSMTGYQEILTDPSYAGQIITMTYPLIGNYGVNDIYNESLKVFAKGFIVKSISKNPSNYLSKDSLDNMLKNMGVVGVSGIDTRSVTKKIRDIGSVKCVISNENLSINDIKSFFENHSIEEEFMKQVSTKEIYGIQGTGKKIALIDFGVKGNIINNLKERNCDVTIFPYDTPYKKIMEFNPDGILLSNGPGDPKFIGRGMDTVKKLIGKKPIFGICLGHQILALALGGDTYKMKFGHRGANHGVYDIKQDRAFITSQNHGYGVKRESLNGTGLTVTHVNLNDNTVEGMEHENLPIFSVQFHPEGSAGPTDTEYLFDQFINNTI